MISGIIDWFVFIFAILVIVKVIVVSYNGRSWTSLVKHLYKAPVVLFVVELVLAALLFYYLLTVMNIVEIMAAVAFGALLTGMTFAVYGHETVKLAENFLRGRNLLRRAWLPILIWLALAIWAILSLL